MSRSDLFRLSCIAALVLALGACARQPVGTADVPRHMAASYRIAVAPFSQPIHPGQLIAGHIPDAQGRITPDALAALDRDLREVLLASTKRQYSFIRQQDVPASLADAHSTGQPGALPRWLEYGREQGLQYLLIPQVLDWHERQGSSAGVTQSAHVRVEFFLVNVAAGELGNRSIYEEKQVGLTENLLTVGQFIKRKGVWVPAETLAVDGMKKAVKDLGL